MAKKSMINKCNAAPKYPARRYNRCKVCGRPRSFIRKFAMCRICFRMYANRGELPGVTKSSW